MSVVIIGTVGIDEIETPFAKAGGVLGGSATYASLAARHFTPTTLTSVVGTDFPTEFRQILQDAAIDLQGMQTVDGMTFRWGGRYSADMNTRETVFVDLNVNRDFSPKVPDHATRGSFVFLGNTDPAIQMLLLNQVTSPALVMVDSMDYWIEANRETLTSVFRRCPCVVLNDSEIRLFSRTHSLPGAVEAIQELGPTAVVVKRGEYGAALATNKEWFFAPGYPLNNVVDPTGAGDAFAGAMLGSLSESANVSAASLRRGIVYGSVVASFTVETLGVERLCTLTREEIDARFTEFKNLVAFT